ncbi:hypothetical protein PY310_17540 [Pseudarthrobacter sp. H3Y2-7]|jgi:hypothetical protein|uniref:hypothetical protein n=1 Tax=Pseudarthrobacter TaxID=1742993 RepID=UPI0023B0A205|nr:MULTISPECIES: hypothetical protein [unclassified Pseudarthrobacter]MDE8670384.1 hypothetical protein [Pseudarthrobacter sp. H3Y2-7]
MYRQGIPSSKIALDTGAPSSTVRYRLHLAGRDDPTLRDARKAALRAVTRKTSAGQRNLDDIIAFHKAEGRPPTTGGQAPRKRHWVLGCTAAGRTPQ